MSAFDTISEYIKEALEAEASKVYNEIPKTQISQTNDDSVLQPKCKKIFVISSDGKKFKFARKQLIKQTKFFKHYEQLKSSNENTLKTNEFSFTNISSDVLSFYKKYIKKCGNIELIDYFYVREMQAIVQFADYIGDDTLKYLVQCEITYEPIIALIEIILGTQPSEGIWGIFEYIDSVDWFRYMRNKHKQKLNVAGIGIHLLYYFSDIVKNSFYEHSDEFYIIKIATTINNNYIKNKTPADYVNMMWKLLLCLAEYRKPEIIQNCNTDLLMSRWLYIIKNSKINTEFIEKLENKYRSQIISSFDMNAIISDYPNLIE